MHHKRNSKIYLLAVLALLIDNGSCVKISTSSFQIFHTPSGHRQHSVFEQEQPSAPSSSFSSSTDYYGRNFPFINTNNFPTSKFSTSNYFSSGLSRALSTSEDVKCEGIPSSPAILECVSETDYSCEYTKYRTFDGSCNNLDHPHWGVPSTRYGRLIPPKYADGIHEPSRSVTGEELPNPRVLSTVIFGEKDIPDPEYTLVNMQWGQIMAHDMSLQAGGTQSKKHSTQCCTTDGKLISEGSVHETCFPIVIPHDDPVYSHADVECLEFVRTLTDKDLKCPDYKQDKPAEQLTVVTHYLDLSIVYGNSKEQNHGLRLFKGGRMITDHRHHHEWLPQSNNATLDCDAHEHDERCYVAGDSRVNQNPGLVMLQTILLKEHNRIADELAILNPHYDDEKLFQEARKINIAEYQYISYIEWLPIFLGTTNMLKNRLIHIPLRPGEFVNDYDPSVHPATLNSHATAAFRYFHTQIEGRLDLLSELRTFEDSLRLSDWFNRPSVIEHHENYDELIRGHATQPEEYTDTNFDREIKHFLLREHDKPLGGDLRAIDIQRDRDHGLASYNDYREFCGLRRAKSFEDLLDHISVIFVQKLKSVYHSVDDIDLTVGASLETHVPSTLAGPTFLCILTEQFFRTRVGDRFFFENGDKYIGFTPEQLTEIRKSSMARLFCDNGNKIKMMQPRAFHLVSLVNPIVPCEVILKVDLSKWKEEPVSLRDSEDHSDFYSDYKK